MHAEKDVNMLIYNNLLINGNSHRYQPFLLNLLSGRRRLLNNDEAAIIKRMVISQGKDNAEEKMLVDKLFNEKQFVTDEVRQSIETLLINSGYFERSNPYAEDYRFSIEITRACNMNCPFCYAASRHEGIKSMTKSHIDAIFLFYSTLADSQEKIRSTPFIRITGGEPLVDRESASLISYIAEKWSNTKISLFTNGVNLLKYYSYIPLERIEDIHVSLDGTRDVHLSRRFANRNPDDMIYEDIIAGIRKLLNDNVNVKVKTVLDRNNYTDISALQKLLTSEGILGSPCCEHLLGITLDYHNDLDILEEVNNKQDVSKIKDHLLGLGLLPPTYPSCSTLMKMMTRSQNKPYLPKCTHCRNGILDNYYFSCNGKVYYCDCIEDDEGIVGTFFPEIILYEDAVRSILSRSVLSNAKCKTCPYKFVCLGGCHLAARTKKQDMACGIFGDEDILDNLEFDYNAVLHGRRKV